MCNEAICRACKGGGQVTYQNRDGFYQGTCMFCEGTGTIGSFDVDVARLIWLDNIYEAECQMGGGTTEYMSDSFFDWLHDEQEKCYVEVK